MCELFLPLYSLRTVNTVTHSYDISAVLPQLLFGQRQREFWTSFLSQNNFSVLLPVTNCMLKFWVDRRFQASAYSPFGTTFTPISLEISTSFFLWYPNIHTYILLCSGTDIKQTARTWIVLIWEEIWASIRQTVFSSNVISAPLSVRRPEVLQVFSRCSAFVMAYRNCEFLFIIVPLCLSLRTNNL
jgi:hypothetical protein